jgi:tight adherence protein B
VVGVIVFLLSVAVALWCLLPSDGRPARFAPRGVAVVKQTSWSPLVLLGALSLVVGLLLGASWMIWLLCVGVVAGTCVWLIRRGRAAKTLRKNREDVLSACSVLAGQLEAGELPAHALRSAAADYPLFAPAVAAIDIGADVPQRLRGIAAQPGCTALDYLADGWQLCDRAGMPLAEMVRRISDAITEEADQAATRETELSSARSTSRMMAGLPVVGLLMGFAVGADPLGFLTGSLIGQLCVLGACVLACAGLIWTEKLSGGTK